MKLPGYVIDELLGQGGSGQVWRARVAATGDPVAIKRIPVGDATQLAAARAEAALLSSLDHPHLVRLHELIPVDGAAVLVLDLAEGGTLSALVERRGRLTAGEVITALAPIGAALAYLHGEGVVHGDVTGANVLFTELGLPLLSDLGVARMVGDARPARSTPAYVDPAVVTGSAPGAQSDVFMLAAVAFHALTGEPVWQGEDVAAMLDHAAAGDLGDLRARLAGVPDEVVRIVQRGLSVEPNRRGSAAEFALDLRHAATPRPVELAAGRTAAALPLPIPADAQSTASPQDPARPAFGRPGTLTSALQAHQLTYGARVGPAPVLPERRRRVPWRWLAAAAVLVAAVAGAVVAWPVSEPDGQRPVVVAQPSRSSASSTAPAVPASPVDVLRRLDALRAEAFARNRPDVLRRVYASAGLLAQDRALLARLAPRGCGVVGALTTFADPVPESAAPGRVALTVTARLEASAVVCDAGRTTPLPGTRAVRLRVVLVQGPDGYRIGSQRVVTTS